MTTLGRARYKAAQIISFFCSTRTPVPLTLDTMKLQTAPFEAISRDGLKLRLNPHCGESFTFYENLICRHYLLSNIKLGAGDTVVDIGANIGSFAVLAASVVGPSGRVIAIEPASATFMRLHENVALNGFSNIICVQGAVDAAPGTLQLHIDPKSALTSAYGVNKTPGSHFETVPCFSLAQIFEQQQIDRVDLLKVDCEGAEYAIFEALSPEFAKRIKQISMEVHPVAGKSFDDLRKRLDELGFDLHTHPGLPWVAFRKNNSS